MDGQTKNGRRPCKGLKRMLRMGEKHAPKQRGQWLFASFSLVRVASNARLLLLLGWEGWGEQSQWHQAGRKGSNGKME